MCAALADRERIAITAIISRAPAEPAALCLRHLAQALSAVPDPATGRALLRALAATLRRDSEDMRAFAVKREAYRSGLVTEEESRAHLDALYRLAGLPALTQPWADQESARVWSWPLSAWARQDEAAAVPSIAPTCCTCLSPWSQWSR